MIPRGVTISILSLMLITLILASPAFSVDEITVAILKDPTSVGLVGAVRDYEKSKGVKVTLVELPFNALFEKLVVNLFDKTGRYDVIMLDDPWFPKLASAAFLSNLDEMFRKRGLSGPDHDFLSKSLDLGKHPYRSGILYAIPYAGNVQLFFYRKDLFEKYSLPSPPKTWNDVLQAASIIREKTKGVYGFVIRGAPGNPIVSDFLPIFWSFGANVFDEKWLPTVNSPNAREALKILLELRKVSPPGIENFGAEKVLVHLLQGTAAQHIGWPSYISQFDDPKRSKVVGKMAIANIPSGKIEGASEIGHWLIAIPEDSRRKAAAFDFILWATNRQQMKVAANRGSSPVRKSLYEDPELLHIYPHYPIQLEAILKSNARPRTPVWDQVENVFGIYLSRVVGSRTSAQDVLDVANTEITDIMRRTGQLKE